MFYTLYKNKAQTRIQWMTIDQTNYVMNNSLVIYRLNFYFNNLMKAKHVFKFPNENLMNIFVHCMAK